MRYFRPLLVLIGIVTAWAAPPADDLDAVFARLDKAAPGFRGFTADIRKVNHSPVVPDDDIQTGKTVVRRAKPHELQIKIDFDPPDQQEIVLDGNKGETYHPKTNSIQPYLLVSKTTKTMADQVLTLGWGSTSQDLKGAYNITYGGQETVAGQKAARLELIPIDKALLAHFPKFELWISEEPATSGIAVQVKVYEKGGDYNIATYTNIKPRNVSESEVKLIAPKDAHREKTIK